MTPNQFRTGAGYVWRGFRLIREPRIRAYVIGPLLVNVMLFSVAIFALSSFVEYALETYLPDWLSWLKYVLWPLFIAANLLIVFYGFTIIANLLASPLNGLLAAAVERHLTGVTEQPPLSWRSVVTELLQSVGSELKKLLYFVCWALPCLIVFIVPGINVIAAPLWFLFGAWMLAIEYVDCPMGNHARGFPAVKHALRDRRKLALGFGSSAMVLTMVPILNFIAMPVGVAAATALYVDELADRANA